MAKRNHMGSEASRARWFNQMLPHIPYSDEDDDETWITGKKLEAAADVSEHQRSAGINWGRREYCGDKEWALVSGRKGYRFVATARQAEPFLVPRFKHVDTLLNVWYWGAQKPLINRAVAAGRLSVLEAKMMEKSLVRVLEDVRDLGSII